MNIASARRRIVPLVFRVAAFASLTALSLQPVQAGRKW